MKTKLLSFLLAGSVLGLAAWLVHRNTRPVADAANGFTPVVQSGEQKPAETSEKYRETVYKGLDYLVKQQHKDGHWEGDDGKHPVAMTGLAGLALLMDQEVHEGWGKSAIRDTKYAANVRKATDWLMDQSRANRDGLIFSENASETARYMQGHGLATLFLAGVCRYEQDEPRKKKLTDVLTRAVKYIAKARSTQGGWYRTSKVEGHDFADISTTVIQIQALRAAENAGIPIPGDVIVGAQDYIRVALEQYEKQTGPGQTRDRLAETAGALACRLQANGYGDPDAWKDKIPDRWLKYCRTSIPVGEEMKLGRDELVHYYYAQAVFSDGGEKWNQYRTATFDHLKSSQNKDGSWPAADGICIGQVYSTAVWCIVLQVEKNSHPSRQLSGLFS